MFRGWKCGSFLHSKNGNINEASGLGTKFGLREEWKTHNDPDIPDHLSNYGQSTPVAPDPGASGNPPQLWWKWVSITGRADDVRRALNGLVYWPDLNWNSAGLNGLDSIALMVEDLGQVGESTETSFDDDY